MTRITLWDELCSPGFLGALCCLGIAGLLIPAIVAASLFTWGLRTIEVAKKHKTTH
jgi:hypothetical protein